MEKVDLQGIRAAKHPHGSHDKSFGKKGRKKGGGKKGGGGKKR